MLLAPLLLSAPLLALPAVSAGAQTSDIAIDQMPTIEGNRLHVTSSAFKPQQAIPVAYTGYGRNEIPALNWAEGPPGTKCYAVIVEDPAGHQAHPVVHWIAYDIPAETTMLPMPGIKQGRNYLGETGYAGPHPPAGDPPHPYHFQVFALDRMLNLPAGAPLNDVKRLMNGHVLAEGELIGTYQATAH